MRKEIPWVRKNVGPKRPPPKAAPPSVDNSHTSTAKIDKATKIARAIEFAARKRCQIFAHD